MAVTDSPDDKELRNPADAMIEIHSSLGYPGSERLSAWKPTSLIMVLACVYKYVPLMEYNLDGDQNNVHDQKIYEASKQPVKSFVDGPFTDKEPSYQTMVRPAIAEIQTSRMNCKPIAAVRFGNVCHSRVKVIPCLKEQIEKGVRSLSNTCAHPPP